VRIPATSQKPAVLFIGNFLSNSVASRGVCEDLVERLRSASCDVRAASANHAKALPMLEMAGGVWRGRRSEDVVHVDVISDWSVVRPRWEGLFTAAFGQEARPPC
jgi:hypothetical protein